MEKHQPVSCNLVTRTLAKSYPKSQELNGICYFPKLCISHCNGYLKKNCTDDLEIWKIQWNLLYVARLSLSNIQAGLYIHA